MATLAIAASKDGDRKTSIDENSSTALRRLSRASTDSNSNPSDTARRPSMLMNMNRRRSSFRNLAHSVNFMRRLSMTRNAIKEKEEEKPKLRYENTYRMEPDDGCKFKSTDVRETVERILNTYLREEKYEERRCRQLAQDITTVVKNSVKDLKMKRYKIVCNVILGEKKGQGVEAVGRCCWDPKTDNFVTVHFENESLFSVCSVHGIYFE